VLECQTARCESGKCNYSGCGANLRCCPGVGCRTCCQNSDCNDGVACTDDTCESGSCRYTPNDANCSTTSESTFRCDRVLGCIQCTTSDECQDSDLCTTSSCVNNRCQFAYKDCGVGQFCCPTTGACGFCCSDCDCIFTAGDSPAIPPPLCSQCISGACQPSADCAC
jgi:hypothetical protein